MSPYIIILLVTILSSSPCVFASNHPDTDALTVVDQSDNNDNDAVAENDDAYKINVIDEVFYPTDQWQSIKPGQAIPSGLHVRLNLETGEREAKLQDEDIEKLKYWSKAGKQGMVNTDSRTFTHDELKKAMKNFRVETHTDKASLEHAEKVRKKYKSYDSLKRDMKTMEMDIRTDQEIITDYVSFMSRDTNTADELASMLVNLEYYVHQFDNAVVFAELGGMDILVKCLNGSNPTLKKEAASVLGAAVQSNPAAQIKALNHGLLPLLLRLLSIDQSKELHKTYLFAVSSLIRHFPHAQSDFVKLGGLSVLSAFFNDEENWRVRVKAVTLLHDLLLEKESAMKLGDAPDEIAKKQQYERIPLVESLVERGWCDLIPRLLTPGSHDINEKTLHAMTDLYQYCQASFTAYLTVLNDYKQDYIKLAAKEKLDDPTDYYFGLILQYIDGLIAEMNRKYEL